MLHFDDVAVVVWDALAENNAPTFPIPSAASRFRRRLDTAGGSVPAVLVQDELARLAVVADHESDLRRDDGVEELVLLFREDLVFVLTRDLHEQVVALPRRGHESFRPELIGSHVSVERLRIDRGDRAGPMLFGGTRRILILDDLRVGVGDFRARSFQPVLMQDHPRRRALRIGLKRQLRR